MFRVVIEDTEDECAPAKTCCSFVGLTLEIEGENINWHSSLIEVVRGEAALTRCNVESLVGHGVKVRRRSVVTLSDCEIRGCLLRGITVYDSSKTTLFSTRVRLCGWSGVAVCGSSFMEVRECRIERNGMSGVVASDRSTLVLRDSDLMWNNKLMLDNADVTIRHRFVRTTIVGNCVSDPGIQVNDVEDMRDWPDNDFSVKKKCSIM
eukprot:TRINITY_DN919_c0_g1_i2.p1 TRINITY_DN919_c0_g1~~TRINITY_DN919_c0_g1_i2.p1  ORF type:complete len:207 (-),score=49.68 TRINITY_DN919_c0_g1_i2:58-678(-)